ncbi:MAG: adenine deaminase [Dehalococcoidales bacterium]|nr:adenine deaminase [Dehalococcoidales bacterium]MDP6738256.1 adenine deaminase [Dehalococcoidales bacterium]
MKTGTIEKARLISIAKGDTPADLVLANTRIVNVFSGEIKSGNVAIGGDKIAGIGDYHRGEQVLDLEGRYLSPGFIDGHTHLESSMLDVAQYARAVVPRGTLAVVTDLHEIANVSGLAGIRYVMSSARRLPLELFLMAPSCVPATHLETSGAKIDAPALRQVLRWRGCLGLGEVMNFPGLLSNDKAVLATIGLAQNEIIDGHAPGISGKELNAYIAAGIYSDHESVSLAEAKEKLSQGMFIMIREGSAENNLEALLPLVTDKTYKRCFFVVDDRNCVDLFRDGTIDAVVRKAIALGLPPIRAIQLATINPAEYFRLRGLGAVAPGYQANLIVIDDLSSLRVDMVFHRGRLVADTGKPLFSVKRAASRGLTNTVKVKPFPIESLQLRASGETLPIIEVIPGQIITRKRIGKIRVRDGMVVPDISRDILKLVVVERHKATGNIGQGMISGLGLKKGALASSIAHDSHNIVAVGTNDEDIYAAIKEIERLQGGLVVVAGGQVLASLTLPIAGLLSTEPLEVVVDKLQHLEQAATHLGARLSSSFSTLSFMALPVIPELRLTDLGLVDVGQFKLIK